MIGMYLSSLIITGLTFAFSYWAYRGAPILLCPLVPLAMTAIGTLLNALVCSANGGRMPVKNSSSYTKRHMPLDDNCRYKLLADLMRVKLPLISVYFVLSIGDVLMLAGFATIIISSAMMLLLS